ncbi:hypothetical protein ACFE04_021809 [Oxalis oulophora]
MSRIIARKGSGYNIPMQGNIGVTKQLTRYLNRALINTWLIVWPVFTKTTPNNVQYAGSAWNELKHIRQAIGFLVIHQKPKKTLDEISHDLCPVLSIQQLYRISTMYCDDKYGTHSVSSDKGKEILSFLLRNFVLRELEGKYCFTPRGQEITCNNQVTLTT